jgi:hypothetical protein
LWQMILTHTAIVVHCFDRRVRCCIVLAIGSVFF